MKKQFNPIRPDQATALQKLASEYNLEVQVTAAPQSNQYLKVRAIPDLPPTFKEAASNISGAYRPTRSETRDLQPIESWTWIIPGPKKTPALYLVDGHLLGRVGDVYVGFFLTGLNDLQVILKGLGRVTIEPIEQGEVSFDPSQYEPALTPKEFLRLVNYLVQR